MKRYLLLLSLLFCSIPVFAQTDRGTITGTVTDPSRAVVPGAEVTARSTETGAISKTVTTGTGNYTIASLPPGLYEVAVQATGFEKFLGQGIQVQVSQTLRLDISLLLGSTADTVSVEATASLLKTESVEQSVNMTGERFDSLPLNFGGGGGNVGAIRSPLTFLPLAPGASGSSPTTDRINGQPAASYRIFVDGQDVTSSNDATSGAGQPGVEMIEEYSLQTSNFAAEYGQVGGGVVTFATRSGANQFHITAFEYKTNEIMDAAKPFVNQTPVSRKDDFGGILSGPVYFPKIYDGRNRTFFTFSDEYFTQNIINAGALNTVPTTAMRGGNFSAALTGRSLGTDPLGRPILENTIYDPATGRVVNGATERDPFPGNIIPVSRMDPVALKIQALMPQPTNGNLINNWLQAPLSQKTSYNAGGKVDQNFGPNNKLSFYMTKAGGHTMQNGLDGLPVPLTAVRDQRTYSYTERVNFDRTITPRLLLHLGAGFLEGVNPDTSPASVLGYNAQQNLGFVGSATAAADGSGGGMPRIAGLTSNFGGMLSMGPTNANHYWNDKVTAVASITHVRGNHTIKLGAEFRLESWTDRNTRQAQGVLNFSATETGLPALQGVNLNGGSVGLPYASFLLGQIDNASVNSPQDPQWRGKRWGLYLQDTWKITPKLTLDYGLRWDVQGEGHELHQRNSEFGPVTPNPSAGGLLGGLIYEGFGPGRCNCQFIQTYPYSIGPRLGIAYQVDKKTVFRGGWGVVYGVLPTYSYFTNSPILGVGWNQQVFANPGYGFPAATLQGGLQYNHSSLSVVTLDPGAVPSPGQLNSPNYYMDPNADRASRENTWSVGLQRELARDLVVEASYVGNRTIWESAGSLVSLNAIPQQTLAAHGLTLTSPASQAILTSLIGSATAINAGFKVPYAGFPLTSTVAQSLRPFPQFSSGLSPMWAPLGDSWYDSLQVKGTKRYSHGLTASLAYTWQKELATGQGVNDVFNRVNQKSIESTSQPQILVISFNYSLPYTVIPRFSTNRVGKAFMRDWTLGGILRYSSGLPIAVPSSTTNLSSLVFQSTRMNRVPGQPLFLQDLNCHCIDPNQQLVLNPAAWVNPPAGQFGTSSPYYSDYRYERFPSEQLSMQRNFRIKEKASLQLRLKYFNVFNRTVLPNPGASNPLASTTRNAQGVLTGGFGWINANSVSGQRNGQVIARFTF